MLPAVIRFRIDDEKKLFRLITIREYCLNELSKIVALDIAVKLIEKAPEYKLEIINECIEDKAANYYSSMPYHVAITFKYESKVDYKNFLEYALEMLKNYNNL